MNEYVLMLFFLILPCLFHPVSSAVQYEEDHRFSNIRLLPSSPLGGNG